MSFLLLFFRLNDLIEVFNDEGQSNYLVAFMRLLCSMQIKKEADLYINFLDGNTDVHTFCALEVEPMFKESDIVHIHALSKVVYFVLYCSLPSKGGLISCLFHLLTQNLF